MLKQTSSLLPIISSHGGARNDSQFLVADGAYRLAKPRSRAAGQDRQPPSLIACLPIVAIGRTPNSAAGKRLHAKLLPTSRVVMHEASSLR